MSTAIVLHTDANIVRMDSEALGQFVAEQTGTILPRLSELRPYYAELWRRFEAGETINRCKTKTEYCQRVLKRSVRSVQFALYGRKPLPRGTENLQESDEAEAARQAELPEIEEQLNVLRDLITEYEVADTISVEPSRTLHEYDITIRIRSLNAGEAEAHIDDVRLMRKRERSRKRRELARTATEASEEAATARQGE